MSMSKMILVFLLTCTILLSSCDSVSDEISQQAAEKLIESLSGDSINVDIDEKNGEISLSITDEDGTKTIEVLAHTIPDDLPSDIYLLKDANRGNVTTISSGEGVVITIQDTLLIDIERARSKIKKNMKGYSLEFESSMDGLVSLMYAKGEGKTCVYTITKDGGVALISYAITY